MVTLLGVYAAGSALGGKTSTGLWAATFWTALCSDLDQMANQPNTEVFINACLIWAFALLVRARANDRDLGRFLVIGLLFSLASLYKPTVAVTAVILSFVHLAAVEEPAARRRAAIQVAVLGVVGLVSWIGTCAYFYAAGRFSPFYETMFVYNRHYAGNLLGNLRKMLDLAYLIPPFPVLILMAPTILGVGLGLSKKPRRPWLLVLGFALGTQITLTLPGKFSYHYYQLWFPLIVVSAAWALEEIELSRLCPRFVPASVGAVALALLLLHQLPFYGFTAEEWSREKYGEIFVASKKMGQELGRLLAPEETFYEWGFEPGLYFYSRRRPPSGVLCFWPLVEGPLISGLSARVLRELEHTQPELFLTCKSDLYAMPPHPVLQWAKSRYRFLAARPPFFIYVRQGRTAWKPGPKYVLNHCRSGID